MPFYPIDDLGDSRLTPYRNLRTTNLTRYSKRFIAESKPLVRRLIESEYQVESVLIDRAYEDEAKQWVPEKIDIFSIPTSGVSELIGFSFHRGYLACGIRPALQDGIDGLASLDLQSQRRWMGVMLVGVQDPENMGSIFRSCAALGIRDVVIGPECVDPFARRVLRVSMGNTFKLHLMETNDPLAMMHALHQRGIETLATCLSQSQVELVSLKSLPPILAMLGNEAHGLPDNLVLAAKHRVRIDMELGTDSLNVSVAAGILLHYLRRIATL